MYYLFSPLLDEEGKPVERKVEVWDWYEPIPNLPTWSVHPTVGKYPILTMAKFADLKSLKEYVERLEGK